MWFIIIVYAFATMLSSIFSGVLIARAIDNLAQLAFAHSNEGKRAIKVDIRRQIISAVAFIIIAAMLMTIVVAVSITQLH